MKKNRRIGLVAALLMALLLLGGAAVAESTLSADGEAAPIAPAIQDVHVHRWSYTASGSAVTARCDGPGACDVTEGLTLRISAPAELTYDGREKAATLNDYSAAAFGDDLTIRYMDGSGSSTTLPPVNAGTYVAYTAPKAGTAAPKAVVRFTIAKADLPAPQALPTPINSNFDGTEHPLVTPPESLPAGCAKVQYSLDGGEIWEDGVPTETETGDYTVDVKYVGDENHNDRMGEPVTAVIDAKPSGMILPTMTAEGEDALKITWTGAYNVQGYDVFLKRCSDKSSGRKVAASVEGGTETTITGLQKHTNYKACVRAWIKSDGQKKYVLDLSPVVHAITGGVAKGVVNPGSLKVDRTAVTIRIDRTIRISGTVRGVAEGRLLKHAPRLRFISSDTGVAVVDKKGDVTGVGGGTCDIYVLTNNGIWKSVKVTVDPSPDRMWFVKPKKYVKVGGRLDLGAVLKLWPGKSKTTLTWTSANEAIATVNKKGVVTGVGRGKTTIRVTAENGKSASVKIKVK